MAYELDVELSVQVEHKEQIDLLTEDLNWNPVDEGEDTEIPGNYRYLFEQVKDGELPFCKELVSLGIAFNTTWPNDGDETQAGTTHLRFTAQGEIQYKDMFKCNDNPTMESLLPFIDNPPVLRAYILSFQAARIRPSFENQIEYGKTYRARRLITPGK
jgi:hypothetical protein